MGWLRKGVGELLRQSGLQLMELLNQKEVRELVGERSQRRAGRTANRLGKRARLPRRDGAEGAGDAGRACRTTEDAELRVGSYEMFHRGEPLTETVRRN